MELTHPAERLRIWVVANLKRLLLAKGSLAKITKSYDLCAGFRDLHRISTS